VSDETIFTNARVVLPHEVLEGSVAIGGGRIRAVDPGASRAAGAVDCEGDYLLPGLIEMHTDNLENHLRPRPGVQWPSGLAALVGHDVQMAGAGVTTVLDSVCCGDLHKDRDRSALLALSVSAVRDGRDKGVLRADHLLHLRCEVCDPAVVELFEPLAGEAILRLVSLMDHTPGQRQFTSLDKFKQYYRGKHVEWTDAVFARQVGDLQAQQAEHAGPNRRRIVAACKARNLPVASHDDTTLEHVEEGLADGVSISEFPTTEEAARAAHEAGVGVVMGGPNVVRSGSHSGNVSARGLAEAGVLDILSSDYAPASLLHSAFLLHQDLGLPLPEALAAVTSTPAQFLQMGDRGEIRPGKRADLARVRLADGYPVVRMVWVKGRRVI
jgi:alpha-D-ribose 1-methylphosphonate 5-triphosphate diphosphatase